MSKKSNIIKYLTSFIAHDFGAYSPIWKWDDLPDDIKDNYELIKDKLNKWEENGYVRIFDNEDGERMIEIFSVPED